jgi:hypothetical protein
MLRFAGKEPGKQVLASSQFSFGFVAAVAPCGIRFHGAFRENAKI